MSPNHYWSRLADMEGEDCPICENSDPRQCDECDGTGSITFSRAMELNEANVNQCDPDLPFEDYQF